MEATDKNKGQPSSELGQMRQRIAELGVTKTERKRLEEKLRESNDFNISLIEQLPNPILIRDLNHRIVLVNPAFERLTGYSAVELVGKKRCPWYSEETPEDKPERDEKAALEGKGKCFEEKFRKKNGEIFYIELKPTALEVNGTVKGYLAIWIDITERKKAEDKLKEYSQNLETLVEERTKELREVQEKLVRKEKLAILGQLAGGVGHELRNPLGAIKNAAYFLNMALTKPAPEVKETLELLQKEVATSEHIISSLLNFAQAKSPIRRKVDINDILLEILSATTVPENVKVVSRLGKSIPRIPADPEQLREVFSNIALNAIQAMPEGGQLTIESQVSAPEWVVISVSDTGVGIAKENLTKLFEPLFTTKAKGIGLGLAVTKSLVERHGGTTEVQSELGKGSAFTVRLPVRIKEE